VPFIQDFIHKFEVGPLFRYFRAGVVIVVIAIVVVSYNLRSYRNFDTPEAMDSAQLARNLAQGKGYTTDFVRPFSIYLVKKRNEAKFGLAPAGQNADYGQMKYQHPDIANPPVYPVLLAGLMKVLPFHFTTQSKSPFLTERGQFSRYQPELIIAALNELIFFAVVVLTFFLARRLFDTTVAWLTALVLLGCETMWRFSVSGLSTMLLLLIFTGVVWCLALIENAAREPVRRQGRMLALSAAAGLLVGVGMLTRYSFGWLIFPLLAFLILYSGSRRAVFFLAALIMFALVVAPWLYRNYQVSGWPFGTANFAIIENTPFFPQDQLPRSLNPDFALMKLQFQHNFVTPYRNKLFGNLREILTEQLPALGGSWVTVLFLAGLLLVFHNIALRRLRYFLIAALVVLIIAQALGRTQLSDETKDFNSENLVVLLVPMAFMYGVGLFVVLLDQMNLLFRGARHLVMALFAAVACLPMAFTFLLPRVLPQGNPYYRPPVIERTAHWMRESELIMSDIPWAVAWYGDRQCVWLTLNATVAPKAKDSRETIFELNDFIKPVTGLYLSPRLMDERFLTEWVQGGEMSWGSFVIDTLAMKQVPPQFPLRYAQGAVQHGHLFLTDWERWNAPRPAASPAPASKE